MRELLSEIELVQERRKAIEKLLAFVMQEYPGLEDKFNNFCGDSFVYNKAIDATRSLSMYEKLLCRVRDDTPVDFEL